MLRKFVGGLVFGAGFSVAVVLAGWLVLSLTWPPQGLFSTSGTTKDFTPEEQIARASVIVLTRYEDRQDGRRVAIVAEILKQSPGVQSPYAVGDEYPSGSHYRRSGTDRGDGMVVFMDGSPASIRYGASFRGDHVTGMGDMPLPLLRAKIAAPAS